MNGATFSLETGRMAKQANGSCVVRMGDTMSLMTVTADKNPSDRDFLPLYVEYRNKTYAAGKIPGGFFKREARPTDRETLSARLIDRPLRPLFPDGFNHETQVVAFIISADTDYHADVLSITGASAALALSDVPFAGFVSGVRVGRVGGEFIVNPTFDQLDQSDLDIIVAGTDDIVCMIEGDCEEIGEDDLLDAIDFARGWIAKLNGLQRELLARAGGKPKWSFTPPARDAAKLERVRGLVADRLRSAIAIQGKLDRQEAVAAVKIGVAEAFTDADGKVDAEALALFDKLEKESMRNLILDQGIRADGRDLTTVRPITIEVGVLPRAHGSCLFTRARPRRWAPARSAASRRSSASSR